MKKHSFEGYTIIQGTNAKENWRILSGAKPSHYFFHLSSFPSGYVILECSKEPPLHVLLHCAQICKDGTKYKNLKNLKVDYCKCNNVVKGDKLGEVIFKSNRRVKIIKCSYTVLNTERH